VRTGAGGHPPFARKNPLPVPLATAPRKSGEWGRAGMASGSVGEWGGLPSEGLYRPVGGGGVGGQRLHLAKSVLVGQSGEGRAKASPSRPLGGRCGPPRMASGVRLTDWGYFLPRTSPRLTHTTQNLPTATQSAFLWVRRKPIDYQRLTKRFTHISHTFPFLER
jgi:hypothetical protein